MRDEGSEQTDGELDPGGYIGQRPELSAETIPGGVGPEDERVAGTATQSTGVGRPDRRGQPSPPPEGHREGAKANDDTLRRAGDSEL